MIMSAQSGQDERLFCAARVSTDHAKGDGQPVVVLANGTILTGPLWIASDYRIEAITAQELNLLRRSLLAKTPGPVADQIANARSKRGRPAAEHPRQRIYVTLTLREIETLRELGGGNVSGGISRLVAAKDRLVDS